MSEACFSDTHITKQGAPRGIPVYRTTPYIFKVSLCTSVICDCKRYVHDVANALTFISLLGH